MKKDLTTSEVARMLKLSIDEIHRIRKNKVAFRGAYKLDPKKRTSPWLYPVKDVNLEKSRREKLVKLRSGM